jgi:hypothetical protein
MVGVIYPNSTTFFFLSLNPVSVSAFDRPERAESIFDVQLTPVVVFKNPTIVSTSAVSVAPNWADPDALRLVEIPDLAE